MAYISEMRIGLATTHNLGNSNFVKIEASVTANLVEDDDPNSVCVDLQNQLATIWEMTYKAQQSRFPNIPRKRELMERNDD